MPWLEIDDATAGDRAPELVLRDALGLQAKASLAASAQPRAEPIAAIRACRSARIAAWSRLLRRHHHETRETPGSPRLLLVAPAGDPPSSEVIGNLMIFQWRDRVGRLDMYLYAAALWEGRALGALERELCVAQTREVAGWCPETAECIAAAGPAPAFDPAPVLAGLASARGWPTAKAPGWAGGGEDRRDGVRMAHACLHSPPFVQAEDDREIARRLWRAQVEVLFPVIELIRAELAREYAHRLRGILDEHTGMPFDPLDVDIGPLAWRLRNAPGVRPIHRDLATALSDVRRPIAHRRHVPRNVALAPLLARAVEDGLRLP